MEFKMESLFDFPSWEEDEQSADLDSQEIIMNERTALENQLFTWKGWDILGDNDYMYYQCTLVVNIDDIPSGTYVNSISLLLSSSKMEMFFSDNSETPDKTFELELRVKNV